MVLATALVVATGRGAVSESAMEAEAGPIAGGFWVWESVDPARATSTNRTSIPISGAKRVVAMFIMIVASRVVFFNLTLFMPQVSVPSETEFGFRCAAPAHCRVGAFVLLARWRR